MFFKKNKEAVRARDIQTDGVRASELREFERQMTQVTSVVERLERNVDSLNLITQETYSRIGGLRKAIMDHFSMTQSDGMDSVTFTHEELFELLSL